MTKPTPTVVDAYMRSVRPVWRSSGVFTRSLSSFTHDKRLAAYKAGFRAIAVQLHNSTTAAANWIELEHTIETMRREGWQPVGWATAGQGTDPYMDGLEQASIARRFMIPWIVNIEAWGEGIYKAVSPQWMRGWDTAPSAALPIMLSCLSSVTANYGRDMDFMPFVSRMGVAISPQVYCASQPLYTLPAMRASFKKTIVPAKRLMPTCNVVAGQPVPARYANWRGPRWLWTGEDCQPADFGKVLVTG